MKYNLFFILALIVLSCNRNNSGTETKVSIEESNRKMAHEIEYNKKVDSLCYQVLIEGDTVSFKELRTIYFVEEKQNQFLYFSTVMAEKHGYAPAFFWNYQILYYRNDPASKKLALFNLVKYIESGRKIDRETVKSKFPNGVPKSDNFWNLDSVK